MHISPNSRKIHWDGINRLTPDKNSPDILISFVPSITMHRAILLLFLIHLPFTSSTASNSLNDCYALAATFSTTCAVNATAPSSITATGGISVTCNTGFNNATCPGVWFNNTCVFAHKLCVTCAPGSPVRIRVQSNGLPRYCPNAPQPISEQNIDFTVNFNPDVSVQAPAYSPTNVSALDAIVCNLQSQSSAPPGSNLVSNGAPLNTLAGVSIDGVAILNVNSANNVDPFYPVGNISAESVDLCLGHPNPQNIYHYHIGSGCALTQPSGNNGPCASSPSCNTNIANYSIASFNSYRNLTVIGIAKDGHIIYGPYTSAGVEVSHECA